MGNNITQFLYHFLYWHFKIRQWSSHVVASSDANFKLGFYFENGVIPPCFVDPWLAEPPTTWDRGRYSRVNGRLQPGPGPVRRDETPFGRSRAAVGGRLLRLPAAAERRERTVEADAAWRAVPELHACGERWQEPGGGQVDVREKQTWEKTQEISLVIHIQSRGSDKSVLHTCKI